MNNNRKAGRIFLLLVFIVALFAVFVIPQNVQQIDASAICQENGDIAIVFNGRDGMKKTIQVFNRDGEKLFGINVYSRGGSLAVCWEGEILCAYPYREETLYRYLRNGEKISEKPFSNSMWYEKYSTDDWEGWKGHIRGKRTTWNDYVYEYSKPILFDLKATLTISHEDRTVTIYNEEYRILHFTDT